MQNFWEQTGLTPVDAAFILLLIMLAGRGLIKGLSQELSGLIVTALTLGGAIYGYAQFADQLMAWTGATSTSARVTAWIASLLILWFVFKLIGRLIEKVLEMTFPAVIERCGGLLSGCAKAAAVVIIIVGLVHVSRHPYLSQHVLQESRIGAFSHTYIPQIYNFLRNKFTQLHPPSDTWMPQEVQRNTETDEPQPRRKLAEPRSYEL